VLSLSKYRWTFSTSIAVFRLIAVLKIPITENHSVFFQDGNNWKFGKTEVFRGALKKKSREGGGAVLEGVAW
jgi:hypothetical protein